MHILSLKNANKFIQNVFFINDPYKNNKYFSTIKYC